MRSFLVIFGALYLAGATVDNALKGCPPAMNSLSKHTLVAKNGAVNQEAFRMLMTTPLCNTCRNVMEDIKRFIGIMEATEAAVEEAYNKECEATFGFLMYWPCKLVFEPLNKLIVDTIIDINDKNNITYVYLYYAPLNRMYAAIGKKYPDLINRTRVPLQQDSAKPRTAKQTKEKIKTLDAIELLSHPANSLDFVSYDYHLFRSMAHFLRGRSFNDLDDVEDGCREFFASKKKEWYRSGIEQLAYRWVQAIDSNGLYFET
uniref:Saposin B-type domain-containing protein n=1 Tax=Bursaphelenchus xylophilus TaxID=6326 RepID=A0A1I7S2B3_BURXY